MSGGKGGEEEKQIAAEAVTFMFNVASDATSRTHEVPLCLHKYG